MVIDDFDVIGVTFAKCETDPPPVVDPNAELALAIATQGLKPVRWQPHEILDAGGIVQNAQPPPSLLFERLKFPNRLPREESGGRFIGRGLYHPRSIIWN
jgi:hypothetical protein